MANKRLRQSGDEVLIPVRCPLKGYTQIIVYFRVDNVEQVTGGARKTVEDHIRLGTTSEEVHAELSSVIRGFEGWKLPFQQPDPSNLSSWAEAIEHAYPLLDWAVGPGYEEAIGRYARSLQQPRKGRKQ